MAVISDVAFIGNSVSGPVDWRPYLLGLAGGGALFVFGSDASGGASVNVLGCSFTNNSVNATDLYPPDSHDNTGQGSLTKGVWLLRRFVCFLHPLLPPPTVVSVLAAFPPRAEASQLSALRMGSCGYQARSVVASR